MNKIKRLLARISLAVRVRSINLRFLIASKYLSLTFNESKIKKLRDKFHGRRCFLIGNGPSLSQMDLTLLEHEVTFVSNKFYKLKTNLTPDFWFIFDILNIEWDYPKIYGNGICKFIPFRSRQSIDEIDNETLLINQLGGVWDFSEDALRGIYKGENVIFSMLQLACYMGFKEIYLIGVDFNWGEGVGHKNTAELIKGQSISATHFVDNYYEEDEPWMSPVLADAITQFRIAKRFTESKGIQVHNAGIDSKLDIFPRKDFNELFD